MNLGSLIEALWIGYSTVQYSTVPSPGDCMNMSEHDRANGGADQLTVFLLSNDYS